MSVVLKPFPYALDGFTVAQAKVGDDIDFAHLTDSLVAAKMIEGGKAKLVDVKPVTPVPEVKTSKD